MTNEEVKITTKQDRGTAEVDAGDYNWPLGRHEGSKLYQI